jgi:hypothetical protein
VTLLGALSVERAYYHCRHCHQGHCPRDARLGLGAADLTPGAEQACALAGVLGSFAEAAQKVLPRLAGLRLAESTVERATERAGQRVGDRLAAGAVFGPPRDWDWQPDAEGKTCAYVAADLFGLGMQGPGGAQAEGRMAPAAMVYNPGVPGQARYLAGLTGGLAALGEPLRRQAGQVGMDRAERWLAVSDGGAGIEDFLRANFPRVEAVILDFWHAAAHVAAWAQALHPDDAAAAERRRGEWCHRLKHAGGAAVLAALEALDEGGWSAGQREAQRALVGYVRNQAHRMDYPRYVAQGWQIGSGPVEAACKLVGQRLKGAGMRWGEGGADAVCHLRALFRSEASQWDAFWRASRAA